MRSMFCWHRAGRWLCAVVIAVAGFSAQAHNAKLSSSALDVVGAAVSVKIEINGQDLAAALAEDPTAPKPIELARDLERINRYLLSNVSLNTAGNPCTSSDLQWQAAGEHFTATMNWRCPDAAAPLSYRVTLFQALDPKARHLVTVEGEQKRMGLLSASSPEMRLGATQSSVWSVLAKYLGLGVEHIAIGFDHIAFLIATVVWGRKWIPLVKIITAFTIAHSITLSLAALGVANPPSQWVELLIAASIIYMAVENFFVRDVGHRWMLTFVFGLIHGFGFAGVLREYGLPRDQLVPALAAFNIGVEVGQLVIVGLVLALLIGADKIARQFNAKRIPDPRVAYAISAVVGALGVHWFVARL